MMPTFANNFGVSRMSPRPIAVFLLAFSLGIPLLVGCGGSSPDAAGPDPSTVIARFDGGEIKRGDIQRALDSNFASLPQPVTSEARQAVVRKIVERRVRTEMLWREAVAKGYPDTPAAIYRQAAAADRLLAERLLESEAATAAASDAVVAAEVDRQLAQAKVEETRKFSHIFLRAPASDAAARQAATATMAKIRQEVAAGASFNELAEQHSTSVMARGGGRIDWTPRGKLHPAVADKVFGLAKEGDLSEVVPTADGLHLFRLDGIRTAAPVDAAAIRATVRQELDAEARNVAIRSRRQQALDAHAVEFAPASRLAQLEQDAGAAGTAWVARWREGSEVKEITEQEIVALHGRLLPTAQPLAVELQWVVENRLLATARRAQGMTPELEQEIAEMRRLTVIDSYRGDLMQELDIPASDEEIAAYYRENAASAAFLRDLQVDSLFLAQEGDAVAKVYAAGEQVVSELRQGVPFDEILTRKLPGAQICRDVHGVDTEQIGQHSIRLRKAIANLTEGEVSAAIYVERPVTLAPGCALEGPGVVFVRLRRIGTLPLEQARLPIAVALSKERVEKGVEAVQQRLIASSKLEILVPEG
jgi:peptidyl-prolyl cis-trans isomerase C